MQKETGWSQVKKEVNQIHESDQSCSRKGNGLSLLQYDHIEDKIGYADMYSWYDGDYHNCHRVLGLMLLLLRPVDELENAEMNGWGMIVYHHAADAS